MSRRGWLVVLAVTLWWTLEGLVTTGQLLTMQFGGDEVLTLGQALRRGIASAWLWIPFSLGLFWLVERFPIERGRLATSIGASFAAVAAIVLLRAVVVYQLNPWLGWYRELPPFRDVLVTSVFNNFLLAWLNIGVAHAWVFGRRALQRQRQAEQLQARLTETRLEALSAQLNPHFLFNALNSMAELVHRDPAAADRMLVGLGELLRSSLDHRQRPLVALHEELRLLRHYLEIEKVRLGERLQLHWDIDASVADALVPPLLLQPLAENAIRHAIAEKIAPGHLGVSVRGDGPWLRLEIRDDGDGRSTAPRHGTGLANIRSRLEVLFGEDFAMELDSSGPEGGTRARLRLPLRRERMAA